MLAVAGTGTVIPPEQGCAAWCPIPRSLAEITPDQHFVCCIPHSSQTRQGPKGVLGPRTFKTNGHVAHSAPRVIILPLRDPEFQVKIIYPIPVGRGPKPGLCF